MSLLRFFVCSLNIFQAQALLTSPPFSDDETTRLSKPPLIHNHQDTAVTRSEQVSSNVIKTLKTDKNLHRSSLKECKRHSYFKDIKAFLQAPEHTTGVPRRRCILCQRQEFTGLEFAKKEQLSSRTIQCAENHTPASTPNTTATEDAPPLTTALLTPITRTSNSFKQTGSDHRYTHDAFFYSQKKLPDLIPISEIKAPKPTLTADDPSILDLARKTGIPAHQIYSWLKVTSKNMKQPRLPYPPPVPCSPNVPPDLKATWALPPPTVDTKDIFPRTPDAPIPYVTLVVPDFVLPPAVKAQPVTAWTLKNFTSGGTLISDMSDLASEHNLS